MKRHGRLIMAWLSVAGLSGCAAGDVTLMQQELHGRETELRACREALGSARFQLAAAQRENQALRAQLDGAGVEALSAEYAAAMFTVKDVAIHRLTGGIDRDGYEGDDALLVFLEPLDNDGDLRKAPGKATIELFDMALDESQRRIGFWQFGPEETHSRWYSGFLMSGYRFELPWQQGYPRHADLVVHTRFETPDGRVFSQTRQIHVRLLPGAESTFSRAVSTPDPAPLAVPPTQRPSGDAGQAQPGEAQAAPAPPPLFPDVDASSGQES